MALPEGTVTFLLSDVEASPAAWERDADRMASALPRALARVERIIEDNGGFVSVERGEGDRRLAAFERAPDALGAAIAIQRTNNEPGDDESLKMRVAVHTGVGQLVDEGTYAGLAIHRAARLRALARGGQIVVSRAAYDLVANALPDDVELVDVGMHRLRDLTGPEQVFLVRHPDLPAVDGGLDSIGSIPHNLPARVSSFVGRDAELIDIGAALVDHRLVTLTGPGGCGKTRLALEAAVDAAPRHEDGVWFVELSAVQDPRLVASAMLDALAIGEAPGQSGGDRLVEYLHARRALLVLDTCEHLVEEVAALAHRLLERCAGLRLLATSREPLGVAGEITWRVPPLGVDNGVGDALDLFVERARGARPTFSLDERQREIAIDVCHRLDGIPLAIELAAARVRTLSLERIAAGLDDRFSLLSGGARTALARHRTLQASVEWSHTLLADDERTAFRRLSVFAGPFDLDAAEAVVPNDDLDRVIVFDLVSRLVDKSLVQIDDERTMRYSLLDTIRQFAADQLSQHDEVAGVRDRHLAYIRSIAQAAEGPIERGDRAVLRDLSGRRGDIRLALEWACSRADGEAALAIMGAVALWWSRVFASEGREWCDRALALVDDDSTGAALKVRWARALMNWSAGDPIACVVEAEQVATLAAHAGESTLQARCLHLSAQIADLVEPRTGEEIALRAAEVAAENGDPWTVADIGRGLVLAALWRGDWEEAERRVLEVEALDDRTDVDHCFLTAARAYSALMRGELESAAATARAAQQMGTDETTGITTATIFRVLALLDLGRIEEAGEALREGEVRLDRQPGPLSSEQLTFARGTVLLWAGDPAGAVAVLQPLHETLALLGIAVLAEHVALFLAVAHRHLGEIDVAMSRAQEAEALSHRTGARRLEAAALLVQSQLAADTDDVKRAETLAHQALAAVSEINDQQWTTVALEHVGCLAARVESRHEAVRILASAHATREQLGLVRGPLDVDVESALASAAGAMPDDQFSAAWTEGLSTPIDEAVAYCRRARGTRARPSSGWESLTPTERQVVELVVLGLTNPQIGERMFIGRGTVKTHLAHIFTKLGLTSRAELAAAAVRHTPN